VQIGLFTAVLTVLWSQIGETGSLRIETGR